MRALVALAQGAAVARVLDWMVANRAERAVVGAGEKLEEGSAATSVGGAVELAEAMGGLRWYQRRCKLWGPSRGSRERGCMCEWQLR